MFNKKILCIGNETEHTDQLVNQLAVSNNSVNYGLISSNNFVPDKFGYYHTTIADIAPGSIVINLSPHFDQIIMLDQHIDSYPHFKSFLIVAIAVLSSAPVIIIKS